MICEVLIEFIENFNDELALLTKLLNPKQIILISNEEKQSIGKLEAVEAYIKKVAPKGKVRSIIYSQAELENLSCQLEPYFKRHVAINLAGTTPLEAIFVMQVKEQYQCDVLYPDIKENRLYYLAGNQMKVLSLAEAIGKLQVDDFLNLSGGILLQDERQKYEEKPYKEMLQFLLTHYKTHFSLIKALLKPSYVRFSKADQLPFYFEIYLGEVSQKQKELLEEVLGILIKINWVKHFEHNEGFIRVYSQTKEMEHYLTSGAWLEHITYHFMKQIPKVTDVHTGFKFAWHEQERHIHNEIDVIATKESNLIGISCKDTDKYDYQTLNELEVYATRLGGLESIKILVVTMPPLKRSTWDRAKGMGIEILQIEEDLNVFGDALKTLMMKK